MTRGAIVRGLLLGAAAGGFAWLFGVQGLRPALIAVCVAAATAAVLSIAPGWYGTWPARPRTATGGGSGQVWRLANRLRRFDNEYDPALQHRLRALAATRLRRLGMEWDDPRAAEALGPAVHAALSEPVRAGLRDVDAVVTAIERLDPPREGAGT